MPRYDSGQLDELLLDVKKLLGDDAPQPPAPSPRVRRPAPSAETKPSLEQTQRFAPVAPPAPSETPQEGIYDGRGHYDWNDPSYTGEYHAPAEPPQAVRRSQGAMPPAASPSAFDRPVERPSRRPPQPRAAVQAPEKPRREKRERRIPQEELEELDETDLESPPPRKGKKAFWIVLLVLLLVGVSAYKLLARQPMNQASGMGARKPGVSTILLVGTDAGGDRTDTLMLLSLDKPGGTASLVSIPRDTRVNGSYQPPKINSVFSFNQGDEKIEMLMQRVGECIGFQPDGYVVVNLDSFVSLVDAMGGVKFNVPQDMRYDDPGQDLHIDLTAGEQKLNGVQAMGLVRFRSGYAAADLQRVSVQRDFVAAAAKQWVKPTLVLKVPQLLSWFGKNVETNLSTGNMTWVALALLGADKDAMEAHTLPGKAVSMNGSFYILSAYDVADMVNRYCNPYERDITVDDLSIRTG